MNPSTLVLARAPFPPDVHARWDALLRRLARNGRGCAHLEREPVGIVCVQHPLIVRCANCTEGHVGTHTADEEFLCDVCRERIDRFGDEKKTQCLAHPVEVDTTVSIGRGRRAAVGIVWLTGWGACPGCWPTLWREVTR